MTIPRIIKFRIWSNEEKRYLSDEEINGIGGHYYNFGVDDDDGRYSLEQFTGLFDKNNNEIYEGDVVEHFDDDIVRRDIVFWNYQGNTTNMLILNPFMKISSFPKDGESKIHIIQVQFSSPENWKVIGNVHSNVYGLRMK